MNALGSQRRGSALAINTPATVDWRTSATRVKAKPEFATLAFDGRPLGEPMLVGRRAVPVEPVEVFLAKRLDPLNFWARSLAPSLEAPPQAVRDNNNPKPQQPDRRQQEVPDPANKKRRRKRNKKKKVGGGKPTPSGF